MACSYLTITTRADGVIALAGEFDIGAACDVADALRRAGPSIHLDLARVTFVDSSGLQTMLRFQQRPGSTLRVVAASPAVRRVFDVAGVSSLLSRGALVEVTDRDERGPVSARRCRRAHLGRSRPSSGMRPSSSETS